MFCLISTGHVLSNDKIIFQQLNEKVTGKRCYTFSALFLPIVLIYAYEARFKRSCHKRNECLFRRISNNLKQGNNLKSA